MGSKHNKYQENTKSNASPFSLVQVKHQSNLC
jgi:hypothetical protein